MDFICLAVNSEENERSGNHHQPAEQQQEPGEQQQQEPGQQQQQEPGQQQQQQLGQQQQQEPGQQQQLELGQQQQQQELGQQQQLEPGQQQQQQEQLELLEHQQQQEQLQLPELQEQQQIQMELEHHEQQYGKEEPEEEEEEDQQDSEYVFNSSFLSHILAKTDQGDELSVCVDSEGREVIISEFTNPQSRLFENEVPFQVLMREEYSDINIVVGSNIIAVHNVVLASHSQFLARILNNHREVGIYDNIHLTDKTHLTDKVSLVLTDASLQGVAKVVHFLYTGELVCGQRELDEVLQLADMLELKSLLSLGMELRGVLDKECEAGGGIQHNNQFPHSRLEPLQPQQQQSHQQQLHKEYYQKGDQELLSSYQTQTRNNVTTELLIPDGSRLSITKLAELKMNATPLAATQMIGPPQMSELHLVGPQLGDGQVGKSVDLLHHTSLNPAHLAAQNTVGENQLGGPIVAATHQLVVHQPEPTRDLHVVVSHGEQQLVGGMDGKGDSHNLADNRKIYSPRKLGPEIEFISLEGFSNSSFITLPCLEDADGSSEHIGGNVAGYAESTEGKKKKEADLVTPVQSPEPPGEERLVTDEAANYSIVTDETANYSIVNVPVQEPPNYQAITPPAPEPQFACSVCGKLFSSQENVAQHVAECHNEKLFTCNTCHKKFTRSHHLKIHNRTHTGEKPYACSLCPKTFYDNSSLRGHMRTHGDESNYPCTTCGKRFKLRANLRQHEATHKPDRPYKCTVCTRAFTFKRNLQRHTEIHSKPPRGSSSWVGREATKQLTEPGGPAAGGEAAAPAGGEQQTKEPREKECSEEQPCSCPVCGIVFSRASTLKQHVNSFHPKAVSFPCSLCQRNFKTDCALRSHLITHSGKVKRHVCEYCNKSWDRPSDLAKHIRVHTGEKPFPCPHCNKRFSDPSFLHRHKRTHQNSKVGPETAVEAGQQAASTLACSVCDKRFLVEANLERHLLTHTNQALTCSACGKTFFDKVSLAAHFNIHNGITPYTCQYCGKNFARLADYTKHQRAHIKIKPFKCAYCNKQFSDSSARKRHEKRHFTILPHTEYFCYGCSSNFLKEELFFNHSTWRKRKCPGRPELHRIPRVFPEDSTVRCLSCKVDFSSCDEIREHILAESKDCRGPIYSKNKLKTPFHSSLQVVDITEVVEKELQENSTTPATQYLMTEVNSTEDKSVDNVLNQLYEIAGADYRIASALPDTE